MKTILLIAILCSSRVALAWDGPGLWYARADGPNPGGGGILGTGGGHDHGIKCTDCHVERKTENLTFDMTFSPPLVNNTYAANTQYTITAKLMGAQLATSSCSTSGGKNNDGFAASFEDDNGDNVGSLAADDGQSAPSCTLTNPAPTSGTTALDGDCDVIFSLGKANMTAWTFAWTAPSSGSVHIYWGAIDGDCDMMSMNDGAVTGSRTLDPAPQFAPSTAARMSNTLLFDVYAATYAWLQSKS
jgi:hypothetical protein